MRQRWRLIFALGIFLFSAGTGVLAKGAGTANAMLNLKAIGRALQIYGRDHDGNLPGSLQELAPSYFPEEMLMDPYAGEPFVYIGAGQRLQTNDDNRVIAYSSWGGNDGIELMHSGYVLRDSKFPAEYHHNPVNREQGRMFWMNYGFFICLICSIGVARYLIERARKKGTIKRVVMIKLATVLPVLIIASGMWFAIFRFVWRADYQRPAALPTRYKNLAPTLAAYAHDHERHLPGELSDLIPKYLHDTRELTNYGLYLGRNKLWVKSVNPTNEIIVAGFDQDEKLYALGNGGGIRQLTRGEFNALNSPQ